MFAHALVVLCVALQSARGVPCSDCGTDPRHATLCALHAEMENAVLREQKRVFKSKDVQERLSALQHVAELTQTHINVPTAAVARFLSDALADESLEVRKAAVRLLVEGQEPDEAARGMVRGLERARRTWQEIESRVVDDGSQRGTVALTIDELTDVPEYVESVLTALGKLRDERSLQALVSYLRSPLDRTPGRFLAAACEATLALDTRRGTEAVIQFLTNLDGALAQGSIPRRFPHPVGRTTLLDDMKAPLENASDGDYTAIVTALRAYADKKQIAPPAESAQRRAEDWRAWFESARDSLPERVAP